MEIKKAQLAQDLGADAINDLSTAGNLTTIRRKIRDAVKLPIGAVPIYQAYQESIQKYGNPCAITEEEILDIVERQARDGVSTIGIHAGLTSSLLNQLKVSRRIMKMVSRGGTLVTAWMIYNRKENPFYSNFEQILRIFRNYDICLTLIAALRPGCIADGLDGLFIKELGTIGELVVRSRLAGVQVKVVTAGHMPIYHVATMIKVAKILCHNAPIGVLGPAVTDVAPAYDHIAHVIGSAIASAEGADYVLSVTPAEHLGFPNLDHLRIGIITMKIAAHVGDMVKLGEKVKNWDRELSIARSNLDWGKQIQLSIDPQKAKEMFLEVSPKGYCTTCGELCAFKLMKKYLKL